MILLKFTKQTVCIWWRYEAIRLKTEQVRGKTLPFHG